MKVVDQLRCVLHMHGYVTFITPSLIRAGECWWGVGVGCRVLDLVSIAAEGASNAYSNVRTVVLSDRNCSRQRLQLAITGDGMLRPYDHHTAVGQQVWSALQGPRRHPCKVKWRSVDIKCLCNDLWS